MSIDITTIGVGVDTSKLKAGTRDLDAFGSSADKAADKADEFGRSTQGAAKASGGLSAATGIATTSLIGLAGAFATLNSIRGITATVDNYVKYTAQLKLATKSQDEYNTALASVNRIANTAQANVSAIATLYARLSNSLQDAGVSQKQLANVTETVALSLKVTGASASETASTMLQLSQAFGSGVLRGDEFNSIAENAPALLRALADSMGVTVGALRGLAHDGQLTSEVLLKAFGDPELVKKLQEQAKEVNTLSGAFETLKNEGGSAIGSLVKDSGLLDVMTSSVLLLRDAIVSLKDVAGNVKPIQTAGLIAGLPAPFQAAIAAAKVVALGRKAGTATTNNPVSGTVGGAVAITGGDAPYPNFNATVVAEDINKIHQQQEEALRIKTEAQKKYEAEVKKSNDAILKSVQDDIREEAETKSILSEGEMKRIKEEQKAREDAYKEQLKQLEELQKVANANFKAAQDAWLKEQEEIRKEFEKTVDAINNIFREGFANLVNGGKGTWKSFTKSLFTTFKTAVADQIYKLFAQPFVVSLVASLTGLTASGGASAASSLVSGSSASGGGFSLMGTGKSIYDAISTGNAGIVSGIENLGAIIANGNGGIRDMLGGFIGQNAGLIADILPYSGAVLSLLKGDIKGAAFQGAGVAIGSYFGGPIGGAIGGAIGSFVGSAFGGGGHAETKAYANQIITPNGTSLLNSRVTKGRGGGAGGYDAGVQGAAGISNGILNITKALGGEIQNAFKLGFVYLSKYDSFGININRDITRRNYDLSFKTGNAQAGTAYTFFQLVNRNFIKLEPVLKSVINRSSITYDNALNAINALGTIQQLNDSLSDLPPIFKSIGDAIKNTVTVDTVGALQARFNAINTYTGLFYTDTEKIATFTKQLTTAFTGLGVALPTSRDGFRSLVDGIDTTTASGLGLFNALVDLAPTADSYYKALQAQNDATKQATDNAYALADALNTNKFKNVVDFTRAQRYQQNGIPLSLLPSYDVGTSYVPNDGPAMLHQGEAVLTKAENAARNSGGDSEIKSLLQQLIIEVRAGNLPQIQALQKLEKYMSRIDEQGISINEESVATGERTTLDVRVVA